MIQLYLLQVNHFLYLIRNNSFQPKYSFTFKKKNTGSNDRTVLIWDLTNTLTLDSHLTGVRSMLFNLASNRAGVPWEFICPIIHEVMKEPVVAEGSEQIPHKFMYKLSHVLMIYKMIPDGFSYEREALTEWFDKGKTTSPMTNLEISSEVMENSILRDKIGNYLRDMDFDPFTFQQNEEM